MRRVAIPRERGQTAAISGLESDGNSGSHAPNSHVLSSVGNPLWDSNVRFGPLARRRGANWRLPGERWIAEPDLHEAPVPGAGSFNLESRNASWGGELCNYIARSVRTQCPPSPGELGRAMSLIQDRKLNPAKSNWPGSFCSPAFRAALRDKDWAGDDEARTGTKRALESCFLS